MKEKFCNGCKKVLPVELFSPEKRAINGYKPRCKECYNAYYREFYKSNYRKTKIKFQKEYYKKNKADISEKAKKLYRTKVKEKAEYHRKYRKINAKSINKRSRDYIKQRRKNDPEFRLLLIMRKQVTRCLKNKRDTTKKILGYNQKDLLNHLGRPPETNETIDHKIPITWFKSGTPPNVINALDNLQIMDASENFKKNNTRACPVPKKYYDIAIKHIKISKQKEVKYV